VSLPDFWSINRKLEANYKFIGVNDVEMFICGKDLWNGRDACWVKPDFRQNLFTYWAPLLGAYRNLMKQFMDIDGNSVGEFCGISLGNTKNACHETHYPTWRPEILSKPTLLFVGNREIPHFPGGNAWQSFRTTCIPIASHVWYIYLLNIYHKNQPFM